VTWWLWRRARRRRRAAGDAEAGLPPHPPKQQQQQFLVSGGGAPTKPLAPTLLAAAGGGVAQPPPLAAPAAAVSRIWFFGYKLPARRTVYATDSSRSGGLLQRHECVDAWLAAALAAVVPVPQGCLLYNDDPPTERPDGSPTGASGGSPGGRGREGSLQGRALLGACGCCQHIAWTAVETGGERFPKRCWICWLAVAAANAPHDWTPSVFALWRANGQPAAASQTLFPAPPGLMGTPGPVHFLHSRSVPHELLPGKPSFAASTAPLPPPRLALSTAGYARPVQYKPCGHAKGVVVWDSHAVAWLVHSLPRWPCHAAARPSGVAPGGLSPVQPSQLDRGQSLLLAALPRGELAAVLRQVRHMQVRPLGKLRCCCCLLSRYGVGVWPGGSG
jgi:hypothetical protein